jgi:hypothetical protein
MRRSESAAGSLFRKVCVVLLLTILPASPLCAGHKDEPRQQRDKSPKVLLSVSPAFGFSPLTVQMVGTLTGVDPRDPNFCHAEITWTRVEPGSSPERSSRITEAPRCLHGESEISVTTTFSKVFDLYQPGPYLYQLTITGKDGTQIRSNLVKVQVLRVP